MIRYSISQVKIQQTPYFQRLIENFDSALKEVNTLNILDHLHMILHLIVYYQTQINECLMLG
ncbi:unnamed protein product [Paramecium primaurelia]|uniref:Uncharacterized protein n=1 Tax=Paramecium primaurelia TaxID=5886 RepID=A0A8S1MJL5_PARPR|nr:unnamed protein product [Paramecium primaurelia]